MRSTSFPPQLHRRTLFCVGLVLATSAAFAAALQTTKGTATETEQVLLDSDGDLFSPEATSDEATHHPGVGGAAFLLEPGDGAQETAGQAGAMTWATVGGASI